MTYSAQHQHRTVQVEPVTVQPRLLAAAQQVERTHRWTTWEWIRWGLPFFLTGLAIGAVATAIINHYLP